MFRLVPPETFAGENWHCRPAQDSREPARFHHLRQVAQQTKSGHIGGRTYTHFEHCVCRPAVQSSHRLDCVTNHLFRCSSGFPGSCNDPGANRLGQHQHVAGLGVCIRDLLARGHDSCDCQSVLGLFIVNRVATNDQDSCFFCFYLPTLENPCDHVRAELPREGCNIQRGKGSPTHGVNIAQGICHRDLAVIERVVDNRCEEVEREYESDAFVYPVDGRVISGFESDQHVRISDGRRWQLA